MFGSGNDSSPFGGGSMFDTTNDSSSSIFGGNSDKKNTQSSMFDSPSEPQGSMFDKPSTPQGSMFDSPSTPQGSMFDSPSTPQGSMFDSPSTPQGKMDIGSPSQGSMFDSPSGPQGGLDIGSPDMDNKLSKINDQDLGIGDSDKYKASYLRGESNVSDLNVRGSNYGNMNLLDRMRGLQANRLNMETDSVSLSEQYSDASLDKRAMGGMYNTTLSDIYNDKTKYAAHHGLTYDGYVDIKDKDYAVDTYASFSDKEEQGTLFGTDYTKEVSAFSEEIDLTKTEAINNYETHYEDPMEKYKKEERSTIGDIGLEQQMPLDKNTNSTFDIANEVSTFGAASLAVTANYGEENEQELTPGEKYKEQRAQDNLAEKEAKLEKKRIEKEQKELYKTEKKEALAQEHIDKVSEMNKMMYNSSETDDTKQSIFDIGSKEEKKDESVLNKSSKQEEKTNNESILDKTSKKEDSSNEHYQSNPMLIEGEELTPGEKLKLQKEEKDLAEKEAKAEAKIIEKEEKEQLKIAKKEQLAQDHIDKISASNKEESETSMYMKKDNKDNENIAVSAFAGGAIDISNNSDKKRKSIFDKDEDEENGILNIKNNSEKNINKDLYTSTKQNDITDTNEHYQSNPMLVEGEKELTPGEKLKLQKEEKDLAEKEQKEEAKIQEKAEKEQLKTAKREQAALDHIDKISASNKEESATSMYFDKDDTNIKTDDTNIMLGSTAGIISGTIGSEKVKHKSIFDKDDEEEEENIFAVKSSSKKINKSLYKLNSEEEQDEKNPFMSIGNKQQEGNHYQSNPMLVEGEKELTPGEKMKLQKEEKDLAEKMQKEENKLQEKAEKEQLKLEKREKIASEHIDKISESYKENNSSIYFESDTNPMTNNDNDDYSDKADDTSPILASPIDIGGSGSKGSEENKSYKEKKIKTSMFDLDEEEELKSEYSPKEELELTPEQKLKALKEEQNLQEAQERDDKKKALKLEKELAKQNKRNEENEDFVKNLSGALAGAAALGSMTSRQTGFFIDEDDSKVILEGSEPIGSIRENIILPELNAGSIKSQNPLNYNEEDEEDDNEILAKNLDMHTRNSKILNYNEDEEDDEENDEPEHFKAKAPIIAKTLLNEEKNISSNIEEYGKNKEKEELKKEKESKMPDEVIDEINGHSHKTKDEEDDFFQKQIKIKALMEKLSINGLEDYLQKIYAKKEKDKIDRFKIKIGEEILSVYL